ncbi:DUF1028 domain-containing protein [Streptomyces rapamycinicus]|uniref:Major pilin protein fimA n=2 Tax=Streptomyces rapamycinicus TaxID=1226757 RepID=A0A0A0NT88_STRRN|nr:DUF1028 domain-containing protein [Streptomyces rapamycinicus]AGP59658.1 hypothetical protein M271_41405 [Streptomyces rapamycinicus NRRL 5491]MBB4789189.1 putative Ntn-hydrolase superfamily protein [Streptomyces rapamycinicus]RLV77158.1 hypothetical protein D3C57_102275 [Streptomyces rapamycinicus NRRL 5491]UTO67354.1 DUF1028 domain-containing protein [Streptomyces rapamycinicus]UTP35311.1 DUF1028 domain-containing protein [Streptomyces rapamycinicus NRRL 5491]
MTFSLVVRDGERFGIVASSSSPAVAARVAHLRPGVGAAASQNVTDPTLGTSLLEELADHGDAERALAAVTGAARNAKSIAYRQLTVVGRSGPGSAYSGSHTLGTYASATAEGAVAAGNMLCGEHIPGVLLDAYSAAPGELEERLVSALKAAVAAGGEEGPVHSAGLAVVADVDWRVTDLRVDWADDPVDRLAELLAVWLPQRDDYVRRGLDPASAPSYGVPGDR